MQEFDAVTLGIVWDRLVSIADEVMEALIRASFSTTVRESHDCSCVIFDAQGRLVAQAQSSIPSFTGTSPLTLAHMLRKYPAASLQPGDVMITNDPWLGTGHTFDISVLRPVFVGPRLVGFVGSISHLPDIGGIGWSTAATEIYQEGLRIPIRKLFHAGVLDQDMIDLIADNVRVSDQVIGDLMANVACTDVGARLLLELMSEQGMADLDVIAGVIIDKTDSAMRAAIRAMPDGNWSHETRIEGVDGILHMACTVTVSGDSIHVDYAGTDPAIHRGINVPMAYTRAQTLYTIKCLTIPGIPNNDGAARAITASAPEGCILNALPPFPTAGRHVPGHSIFPLIMGALSAVMPDRVQAESGGGTVLNIQGVRNGRPMGQTFFCAGGYGALERFDGHGATPSPSNLHSMPVEVWENMTGLLVEFKELLMDSGGPGQARGGLGQRMAMRNMTGHKMFVSSFSGRMKIGAQGLFGGKPGALRKYWVNDKLVDSKARYELRPNDRLITSDAGGGGFGDPALRPREKIEHDLRQGFVSAEAAARDYGYKTSN
jgi:N-methylhydantoinase B